MRTKKEVYSFDVSNMTKEEIREMFAVMPIKSLKTWMEYYEKREHYEVCAILQEIIDEKNR